MVALRVSSLRTEILRLSVRTSALSSRGLLYQQGSLKPFIVAQLEPESKLLTLGNYTPELNFTMTPKPSEACALEAFVPPPKKKSRPVHQQYSTGHLSESNIRLGDCRRKSSNSAMPLPVSGYPIPGHGALGGSRYIKRTGKGIVPRVYYA